MADSQLRILIELDAAGAITNAEDMRAAIGAIQSESASSSFSLLNFGATTGHVLDRGIVAWDRYSIAQNAVENAQIRQTLSAERLAAAIQRHGAGSKEAAKAQQELDIATRGVEIAQQREQVRMVVGIAVVIPSMLKGIRDLIGMAKALDVANLANVATTDALTSSRLALLAATGVGIIAAVGIGAAIAGGAFSVKTATPSGGGGGDINLYGDMNVTGVQSPADFGRDVSKQAQGQINRSSRP